MSGTARPISELFWLRASRSRTTSKSVQERRSGRQAKYSFHGEDCWRLFCSIHSPEPEAYFRGIFCSAFSLVGDSRRLPQPVPPSLGALAAERSRTNIDSTKNSFTGYGSFKKVTPRPFEFNSAELDADQVEVAVEYCGICHSDSSLLDDWGTTKCARREEIQGEGRKGPDQLRPRCDECSPRSRLALKDSSLPRSRKVTQAKCA